MPHDFESFKKRWNWNQSTQTITVEGRQFKLVYPYEETDCMEIEFDPKDKSSTIRINKIFFEIHAINQDAILYHEIGHNIMQHYPNKGMPKSVKEFFKRIIDAFKRLLWKIRAKIKYGKDVHGSASNELEADRYAANRYGNDVMKNALDAIYKAILNTTKNKKTLDDFINSRKVEILKALKDPNSRVSQDARNQYESLKRKDPRNKNLSYEEFIKMYVPNVLKNLRNININKLSKEDPALINRKKALDDEKLNRRGKYGRMDPNYKPPQQKKKNTIKKESFELLPDLI